MKEKRESGLYRTSKKVKKAIDRLLEENCFNVANSDTGSSKDIGGDDEVEKAWVELQFKIKDLDPLFYNSIKSQND
jgi:hypothetical protein|tara:strand:+ start:4986 stop:5213 length:228 start_codon:yes stop_codon:yes gene_type:complete